MTTILRSARTPKGTKVRTSWSSDEALAQTSPGNHIVSHGDSHYGRVEAMEWAEDDDADSFSA